MKYVKQLIDKASQVCGGDAALARRMKISHALLTMMKKGDRAMTPATAVELADIAGVDVTQTLYMAVIDNEKKAERRAMLIEILGKGLAAGGAAMLATSYNTASQTDTKNNAKTLTVSEQVIHRV